jgi:AcrR family transcriptional regulator
MSTPKTRVRMTGQERRQQLLDVGRGVFAEKGFDGTSVEEIAQRAGVTKPVVYEHFGGKEGLYAVIVDREVQTLLTQVTTALGDGGARLRLERAADAFLAYIEHQPDGFRVLVRDSPAVTAGGTFGSVMGDVASQVEHILVAEFKRRSLNTKLAPLYARALVGMVAHVGQWWLEAGKPRRRIVAAHLVNLGWNGLAALEVDPVASFGATRS